MAQRILEWRLATLLIVKINFVWAMISMLCPGLKGRKISAQAEANAEACVTVSPERQALKGRKMMQRTHFGLEE